MKIKLISGKRLPRYAVICANFAVVDNFSIGDFHKLQNGRAVEVDVSIGEQLVVGGWCKFIPASSIQEEKAEYDTGEKGK